MRQEHGAPVPVVGGGPAGLMAAEILATAGIEVAVYERMPSVARKFLMAGRGGLNLTHGEDLERLLARYGAARERLAPAIRDFPPDRLREWCEDLGEATMVGSSGRVFPASWKASPLLRAWLDRLKGLGVRILPRHEWRGWNAAGDLVFASPQGPVHAPCADGAILALGGASWPRLGSNGEWAEILRREGIAVAPFLPSNCGIRVPWSDVFRQRFEGQPLKRVALSVGGASARGEAVVTRTGLEGGAVYALSGPIRAALASGDATLRIDLRPDVPERDLTARLGRPRGRQSLSNTLRKAAGLSPLAVGLLREGNRSLPDSPAELARLIKNLPLPVQGVQGLERAISTAGGIRLDQIDDQFMLVARPGIFVAGEMLDWDAPTGGYLLQACFSTGVAAARGLVRRLLQAASG